MKKISVIFFMSMLILLVGCEQSAAPGLTLTGRVADTSNARLRNTILAVGVLTWQGKSEKENRELVIPINSSTKITNKKGKELKIENLKQDDKIIAVFEKGTKIGPPFPGEASEPALKIQVAR